MIILFQNVMLAFVWTLLTGDISYSNLLMGFLLGYGILHSQQALRDRTGYFQKGRQLVAFIVYFGWELLVSSFRVAHDVLTPTFYARPGIIAIPLEAKTDLEITSLANAITLTPGTLSLDLSDDRKTLYIHALFADDPDAVRRDIKEGMERRLLELLR
jgi:multicomponent Na+:H+ antiporter subunit E